MNEFIENLKRQAEANPIFALGVAAGLITAIGKLMDSSTNSRNAKAWAREVARRERMVPKK